MKQRRRSRTGLHVGSGEGLVVTVALVDAVQLSAHTVAVRLCGTAGERQENGYDGQQMSHSAKVISVFQTPYRYDFHSIGTSISNLTTRENYHQVGLTNGYLLLLLVVLAD